MAQANPYNSPQGMLDSQGNQHIVPATSWLVEFAPGQVAILSAEAFRAQYEKDVALTPLESFVAAVQDLRGADVMAYQRATSMEDRISALEDVLASMRDALSNVAVPQLTFPTLTE